MHETEADRRERMTAEFRIRMARRIVERGPRDHRFEDAARDLANLEPWYLAKYGTEAPR